MEEPSVDGQGNDENSVSAESSAASSSSMTPPEEGEGESMLENKQNTNGCNESDEEMGPVVRVRRQIHKFSDSDTDSDSGNLIINKEHAHSFDEIRASSKNVLGNQTLEGVTSSSDDEDGKNIFIQKPKKSRLQKFSDSSDSSDNSNADSDTNTSLHKSIKNDSRMRAKRNKLMSKRNQDFFKNKESDSSEEDVSIDEIGQNTKERTMQITSSICDPDTSDEEVAAMPREISKPQKQRKSTKPISPQPMRMSAKQAMENMQKIKSESNRMLREKDVSLPYHRPKALTLQAILSKRRPAVSADGKALPIKMNEDQLRQYAKQLEERQKEVIELCKSDSEEDKAENDNSENNDIKENVLNVNNDDIILEKSSEIKDFEKQIEIENGVENLTETEITSLNDTLFDDLSKTDGVQNKSKDEVVISTESNEINHIDNDKMDVDEISEDIETNDNKLQKEIVDVNPTVSENSDEGNQNNSADMELLYNDSVEDTSAANTIAENFDPSAQNSELKSKKETSNSEVDSQLISLHYDTEKTEANSENVENIIPEKPNENNQRTSEKNSEDEFSDEELNMDVIDALIENAEVTLSQNMSNVNSPMLIKEPDLSKKPKLYGAPGMVIDLDGTDPFAPKKLTGVELLKERFVYFSKLKTPEELERDKEKKLKPGMQHLRLKHELQEKIAEQRSLEWAKRLEEEKQKKGELYCKKGEASDVEDIDEIEAKLESKDEAKEQENASSESEEEEEEIEQEIFDKPRKHNPMVDDEAEESDCDEVEGEQQYYEENDEDEGNQADEEENDDEDEESEESSEESEDEQQKKPRKGRILKAFEDSDDEESLKVENIESKNLNDIVKNNENPDIRQNINSVETIKETQDDVIQLAQKSMSEDLFTSQESRATKSSKENLNSQISHENENFDDKDLGTQTFSILETSAKDCINIDSIMPEKLPIDGSDTQPFEDNLDAVAVMCSGSFSQSQNLVTPSQITDVPPSQVIGEDVLALCTGKFYDNEFVSQVDEENADFQTDEANTLDFIESNLDKPTAVTDSINLHDDDSEKKDSISSNLDNLEENTSKENIESELDKEKSKKISEDPNLTSILDELNDPEFDKPKSYKYFDGNTQDKENRSSGANAQLKKRFIIDSDDEENETSSKQKKKIKKKNLEQRALQISDDEDDEIEPEEEDYESDAALDEEERVVEYDSDENEVIVAPQNPKKKRKLAEFFENEAELTSEDEWVGSGDEDEAGLDRMEREEGDDETFNQNKLQRELGQIHMRDVLDQDKREVRLIQELLFEDGDLGGGSRQRKFRWKNADGEEETGTLIDEFADTQEEEFESEEQWRKQRHEREMFLRSLKNEEEEQESFNISVNRTSIIKANLSKNSSSLFVELNTSVEKTESPLPTVEKKTAKDIPSPKKPFGIFQQSFHNSLLARGGGALARLAALATPLAADDDAPKGALVPSTKRNFVFAALDRTDDHKPKVTKRKADVSIGTPRLVKKLRTEDKEKNRRSSLLDHLKS